MLAALAETSWVAEAAALDSTYVKAHRSAHGGKGGPEPSRRPVARRADYKSPRPCRRPRATGGYPSHARQRFGRENRARCRRGGAPPLKRLIADRGYDADTLRRELKVAGIT